jgi:UPF0755 protein
MARRRRRKPLVTFLLVLINILLICFVIVVAISIGKFAFSWGYNKVLDDNGTSKSEGIGQEIEIYFPENSSIDSIADELKMKGLIKYPILFKTISKITGEVNEYVSGKHIFNTSMEYEDIIKELKSRDSIPIKQREVTRITIPEGYELEQIAEYLEDKNLVDKNKFLNVLNTKEFDYEFLNYEEIKNKKGRMYFLEGYLFPDTYEVYVDSSEEEIIKKMLDQFNYKFKPEYYERAKELGLTVDEIVTIASIIEKEAMLDEERPRVAAVFYNRLNSKNYQRLESCATVQYILEERVEVILNKHKEIDSPYNTYMYSGLPIGPIASFGEASLKAALYPLESCDDLFFVVSESGEHIFSKTFEEHVNAINRLN